MLLYILIKKGGTIIMKYTHWNTSKMVEQLAILRKLYRETRNEDILYDIDLLESAKGRPIKPFEFSGSFRDQFVEEVFAVKSNIPFLEDIAIFSELDSLLRRDLIDYEDEYKITAKDLLEFTHDFYKGIDPEIAKIFFRIFKERKNNLKFTQDRGITFTIDKLNYSYIGIARNDVVADYINAVHEYAHAISDRIFYRNNYNSGYPFIELMPLFMELLACDKMMEVFSNIGKDVTGYKADELDTMIQFARHIDAMACYMSMINFSKDHIPGKKKDIIGDMMSKLHTKREEVLTILDLSTLERLSYLIPYMTAVELYYLYKRDPERAIRILKYLVKMPSQENYNIALMDREIYLNEHARKLTLDINRDLKNFRN